MTLLNIVMRTLTHLLKHKQKKVISIDLFLAIEDEHEFSLFICWITPGSLIRIFFYCNVFLLWYFPFKWRTKKTRVLFKFCCCLVFSFFIWFLLDRWFFVVQFTRKKMILSKLVSVLVSFWIPRPQNTNSIMNFIRFFSLNYYLNFTCNKSGFKLRFR